MGIAKHCRKNKTVAPNLQLGLQAATILTAQWTPCCSQCWDSCHVLPTLLCLQLRAGIPPARQLCLNCIGLGSVPFMFSYITWLYHCMPRSLTCYGHFEVHCVNGPHLIWTSFNGSHKIYYSWYLSSQHSPWHQIGEQIIFGDCI